MFLTQSPLCRMVQAVSSVQLSGEAGVVTRNLYDQA